MSTQGYRTAADFKRARNAHRELPHVGFFAGGYPDDPSLPRAETLVDETWAAEERAQLISYLKSATVVASYRGSSPCRICGERNGSQERSDGVYVWPSGFAHYLEAHGVKPPEAFVAHALAALSAS